MAMRTERHFFVVLVIFFHIASAGYCSAGDSNDVIGQDAEISSSGDIFDDEILDSVSSDQTTDKLVESVSTAVDHQLVNPDDHSLADKKFSYQDSLNSIDTSVSAAYYARRSITSTEPVPEPVGLSLLGMAMVFILMAYSIFRKQQEAEYASATDPTTP
jgi:hypothetical protein